MPYRFVDMHCHLDFVGNLSQLTSAFENLDVAFFTTTVDPKEYKAAQAALGTYGNIRIGAGLHPWWIADKRCGLADADLLCQIIASDGNRYVGEVGLDFSKNSHGDRQVYQVEALDRILKTCAAHPGKLLSLHAVRSAFMVLDLLERWRTLDNNQVIMHWFSGTSEDLQRAIRMGCFFSVNPRMLTTGKGREYVRQIPVQRLLLETDLPADKGDDFDLAEHREMLSLMADAISGLKGADCVEVMARNSCELLGF